MVTADCSELIFKCLPTLNNLLHWFLPILLSIVPMHIKGDGEYTLASRERCNSSLGKRGRWWISLHINYWLPSGFSVKIGLREKWGWFKAMLEKKKKTWGTSIWGNTDGLVGLCAHAQNKQPLLTMRTNISSIRPAIEIFQSGPKCCTDPYC